MSVIVNVLDAIEDALQAERRAKPYYTSRHNGTHRDFAKNDAGFQQACANVKIPPSKRQASKWRRKMGLAWKEGRRS